MTNTQLHIAVGVPVLFNGALIGFLMLYISAKFETTIEAVRRVEGVLDARLKHVEDKLGIK